MIFASMSSDAVGFLREARWLRLRLARTSGENQISQISSLRHEKSPPRAGRSVAQRRGFEPPDESPPSHDFQSCSLNHSDISAKPCNHIIFPQKRQLILRAFRQKVFGNFLFPPMRGRRGKKREKHASKRVKSCKKAEEFDIRLCRCVLLCDTVREQYERAFDRVPIIPLQYKIREERSMKKEFFPHLLTAPFPWCKIEERVRAKRFPQTIFEDQ